jgi:hypothetical protein
MPKEICLFMTLWRSVSRVAIKSKVIHFMLDSPLIAVTPFFSRSDFWPEQSCYITFFKLRCKCGHAHYSDRLFLGQTNPGIVVSNPGRDINSVRVFRCRLVYLKISEIGQFLIQRTLSTV